MCLGAVIFAFVTLRVVVSHGMFLEFIWKSPRILVKHLQFQMVSIISNIKLCKDKMKLSILPYKNSENLDMIHNIEKTWIIGNRWFWIWINQLKTIPSDRDMLGYCSTKTEILLQFGENYGILNNLKKRKQFYVLLLMAPLQAPLVTFGIVIKSKLQ